MNLSALIRKAREKAGMTQVTLAKQTGLSRTYICDVENGRYKPSGKAIEKIAEATGSTLIFLQDNDGNTSTSRSEEAGCKSH